MTVFRILIDGMKALWHKGQRSQDLEEELQSYLRASAEENVRRGMDRGEALRAAKAEMGSTEMVKQKVWSAGWESAAASLWMDLRYSLRRLRKSPGFTLVCILTLSLGIGASTAVFSVFDAIILRPLSFPESGQLVVAWERVGFLSSDPIGPNPRHVDLWQKRSTAFSALTLIQYGSTGLAIGNDHPRLVGTVTSQPNLFDLLQVEPLLGRSFRPEDGIPGRDKVVVLTYDLWTNLFHADPNVIGKIVRLGDGPREIIGVLPAGFRFPKSNALRAFPTNETAGSTPEAALFVPAALDINEFGWNGDYGNWIALGRLKPGVSVRTAEAQLTAIEAQILEEISADERSSDQRLAVLVQPLQEAVASRYRAGLWLLMAVVTGFLLIGCLNLANAQLGRALARNHEAALRSALGASPLQLLSGSLVESLLLTFLGGSAGILMATAAIKVFRHGFPIDLPRLAEVHINVDVLLFALTLTLSASLLFGIIPACKFLFVAPQANLQQQSNRTTSSSGSHRIRIWLIGLQVFGCTLLLLLTGFFSKSLLYLLHQDKGFDTAHVVVAQVNLAGKTYATDPSRIAFDDAVLDNLRAIPGVQSAGLVNAMPLEGESWIEPIRRIDRPSQATPLINLRWISPGYFEAIHQRLISGRLFEERDRNLHGVILSQGTARSVWRDRDPLGAQVEVEGRTFTVVGVVADSLNTSLKTASPKMAYLHYADRPPANVFFTVRAVQPASVLISSVRQAIWKHAPETTIVRVKTLDSQYSDSLATERFQTRVLTATGLAALLLAMLGIYSVLSYAVTLREKEIGIRIALGANNRQIYSLILAQAARPVLAGLVMGSVIGCVTTHLLQNLLYGVKAFDPPVIAAVILFFMAAALAAAILPAHRAASLDPIETLRME